MSFFISSIAMTTMFYIIATYVSYMAMFILYRGVKYKLITPTVKSFMFIMLCYISIIADVVLFDSAMYEFITIKNGVFTLIAISSLISARK